MKKAPKVTASQMTLPLTIERELEVDGVGMGVLSDGTPYLTMRGLARLCGVDHAIINRITSGWSLPVLRPREQKIKDNLEQQGVRLAQPFLPIPRDGILHHAYPDSFCMAVLEYYAFEVGQASNSHALKNYRLLARRSFREFIYTSTGYRPTNGVAIAWQQFHDRVSLVYDNVPDGYFGVFKEVAQLVVTLIKEGACVGCEFVPDISVGQHWSKHWCQNRLDAIYGQRREYNHNYPEYFPQAASNPQKPFCYPDEALAEFKRWVRTVYLPAKLPSYLKSKVRQGNLPSAAANAAIHALNAPSRRQQLQ